MSYDWQISQMIFEIEDNVCEENLKNNAFLRGQIFALNRLKQRVKDLQEIPKDGIQTPNYDEINSGNDPISIL